MIDFATDREEEDDSANAMQIGSEVATALSKEPAPSVQAMAAPPMGPGAIPPQVPGGVPEGGPMPAPQGPAPGGPVPGPAPMPVPGGPPVAPAPMPAPMPGIVGAQTLSPEDIAAASQANAGSQAEALSKNEQAGQQALHDQEQAAQAEAEARQPILDEAVKRQAEYQSAFAAASKARMESDQKAQVAIDDSIRKQQELADTSPDQSGQRSRRAKRSWRGSASSGRP